uniref:Neur_chan_memb domain-containing protein n=1 Tax=Parastrongyloides trichosuri TaxID=131310 RepID=A0A0N4Z0R9_PARTI
MKDEGFANTDNEPSNFYLRTEKFFAAKGVVFDKQDKNMYKMVKPHFSKEFKYPDDIAGKKIRVFPFCAIEIDFIPPAIHTMDVEIYIEETNEKTGQIKKIDLCSFNIAGSYMQKLIGGTILIFFAFVFSALTIILPFKAMANSCVDSNVNMIAVIICVLGLICLPVGSIIINSSLGMFLSDTGLSEETLIKYGLPRPKFSSSMITGVVLLIIQFVGSIFFNVVAAIFRDRELKKIRGQLAKMEEEDSNNVGENKKYKDKNH